MCEALFTTPQVELLLGMMSQVDRSRIVSTKNTQSFSQNSYFQWDKGQRMHFMQRNSHLAFPINSPRKRYAYTISFCVNGAFLRELKEIRKSSYCDLDLYCYLICIISLYSFKLFFTFRRRYKAKHGQVKILGMNRFGFQ